MIVNKITNIFVELEKKRKHKTLYKFFTSINQYIESSIASIDYNQTTLDRLLFYYYEMGALFYQLYDIKHLIEEWKEYIDKCMY